MNTSAREDIENIFELLETASLEWTDGALIGEIKLNEKAIELLKKLNESENTSLEVRANGLIVPTPTLRAGTQAHISINPPRGWITSLARDEKDLLAISSIHSLPQSFALTTNKYISWRDDPAAPKKLTISLASQLIKRLLEIEVIDATGESFSISNHDTKIKAPFSADFDLIKSKAINIEEALNALNDITKDSLHLSEKKRILRNSLISALKGCEEEQRLNHFFKHCSEITRNAQHNYEIFISNFSFQDDLDKLHEAKRDFSIKLNSLLIGIQGKLLAIPISTILATTQFKDEKSPDHVLINTTVMGSSLLFLLIITWLIKSQIEAINSIKFEITSKEDRFKLSLPKLYKEVSNIFTSLKSSCMLNLRMARILILLSFGLTFITWHVFLLKTPEIFWIVDSTINHFHDLKEWLSNIAHKASQTMDCISTSIKSSFSK